MKIVTQQEDRYRWVDIAGTVGLGVLITVVAVVAYLVFAGSGYGVLKIVGGLVAALLGLAIYFIPTIIAAKHPLVAPVVVLNVFLGWTFVGWVVALALAVWPMQRNAIGGK